VAGLRETQREKDLCGGNVLIGFQGRSSVALALREGGARKKSSEMASIGSRVKELDDHSESQTEGAIWNVARSNGGVSVSNSELSSKILPLQTSEGAVERGYVDTMDRSYRKGSLDRRDRSSPEADCREVLKTSRTSVDLLWAQYGR
jgi:hypothetical protein